MNLKKQIEVAEAQVKILKEIQRCGFAFGKTVILDEARDDWVTKLEFNLLQSIVQKMKGISVLFFHSPNGDGRQEATLIGGSLQEELALRKWAGLHDYFFVGRRTLITFSDEERVHRRLSKIFTGNPHFKTISQKINKDGVIQHTVNGKKVPYQQKWSLGLVCLYDDCLGSMPLRKENVIWHRRDF